MKRILLTTICLCSLSMFAQVPGSLDTSFGTGGKVLTPFLASYDEASSIAIQPDGKIIVAGSVVITPDGFNFGAARYNFDGTLDSSFGTGGKVSYDITGFWDNERRDYAQSVALQADGKIVLGGYCPNNNWQDSNDAFALIRINADGSLDTSFNTTGKLKFNFNGGNCEAYGMAIQPNGKIVIAGYTNDGSSDYDFAVARINTDGTMDLDFSNDGKNTTDLSTYDKGAAVVIDANNKILVVGDANNKLGMVRYSQFGSLDSTFGTNGVVVTDIAGNGEEITAVALQPDGKIVVAGSCYGTSYDMLLARYNTDGTLDTDFGTAGLVRQDFDNGSEDTATSVVIQADGRIIVVGKVYTGGLYYFALARYNANGTIDTTFGLDGTRLTSFGTGWSFANAAMLQADGRLIVAGEYGSIPDFAVARYHTSSDLSVGANQKAEFSVYPNPVAKRLFLNLPETVTSLNYNIIDINGRIVSQGEAANREIDVEALQSGLYLIDIANVKIKFVKQ